MNNLEPRIYVACLAAYNNGFLHGEWIDANQDAESLYAEIKKILISSPIPKAEEWSIHDFEGFGNLHINEYTDLENVSSLAKFVVEHGELGTEVLSYFGGDLDDAERAVEECYHGEFASEEDFAYHWTHEIDCREVPGYLQHYIDYQAMARDFFINDFYSIEIRHKVHVFSNY
jgi:antirestriction protein